MTFRKVCFLIIYLLFHGLLLTFYFSNVDLSSSALPGIVGFNLDDYTHFTVIDCYSNALSSGIYPLGVFWSRNLYGGAPATTYQGSFEIVDYILFSLYCLTNNLFTSVKILIFASMLLAASNFYFYGRKILKNNIGIEEYSC